MNDAADVKKGPGGFGASDQSPCRRTATRLLKKIPPRGLRHTRLYSAVSCQPECVLKVAKQLLWSYAIASSPTQSGFTFAAQRAP